MRGIKHFMIECLLGMLTGFFGLLGFAYGDDVIYMVTTAETHHTYMVNPHAPSLKINPAAKPDVSQIEDMRGVDNSTDSE